MGEAEEQIRQLEEEIAANEKKKSFRKKMLDSTRYLIPVYPILGGIATYIVAQSDVPPIGAAIAGFGFTAIPVIVWVTKAQDFKQGIRDIDTINEGNRYFVEQLKKDSRSYRS